jgi:hypothetical protein
MRNAITTLAAAALLAGTLTATASASHGGGTKTVLPAPPIPPATFEGIGPGPLYVHESFGHAQRTRYTQNGSVIDVVDKPDIGGIRAEFPNNATETWIGSRSEPNWRFSVTSPADPFEPFTPLQDAGLLGIQDGTLSIVGAEPGTDTRPAAVLPFAAPAGSAFTVSADSVPFIGRTAIGFTTSSATTRNFETGGQAWLELDAATSTWTFHAGPSLAAGSYAKSPSGYDRMAVTYDPVGHIAAATVDGAVVASIPYSAQPIRYVGVEGSLHGNVDNFTVSA